MALENIDPLSLDETNEENKDDFENQEDDSVSLWEHERLSLIPFKVFRGHTDAVSCCHFCLDDTRILTSSHDRTATLWDSDSGTPLHVFKDGHQSIITECTLIPKKNRLITVSLDKTLVAWDLETGKILWTAPHGGFVTSCSASGDGKLVASASDQENAIYLTDTDTGERVLYLKGHHKSTITCCRFDPQGQRVASVSNDTTIKLWDLVSNKTTLAINRPPLDLDLVLGNSASQSVTSQQEAGLIPSQSKDPLLSGREPNHTNVISSCCFNHNGHSLCSASWDKTLQVWDVHEGTFRSCGGAVLGRGHDGSISSCMFSNDSSLLVSGAFDRTVAVWDMTAFCRTLVLKGHSDWVTDVSISADKKWVASASKDSTVRLWNIENAEQIPEVIERRKTQGMGFHILKCEECGKPFSLSRAETSDLITKCVFCRLKTPTRYHPQPPPLLSIN